MAKDTLQLTGSVTDEFFDGDFKVSDKLPAVYERHMQELSGKPGNRTLLNPERYKAIINYIRCGCKPRHAASAVGIDERTLKKWVQKGLDEPDSIYGLFVEDLERAKGLAITRNVMIIQNAARNDWKAADRLLQILDEEFNPKICKMEISANEGANVTVNQIIISDDELKKLTMLQEMIEEQNKVREEDINLLPEATEVVEVVKAQPEKKKDVKVIEVEIDQDYPDIE